MHELSYGIIPLRQEHKDWEILLVQHHAGYWSFPKGHPEKGESPKQSAERELNEETGLTVSRYLRDEPLSENYFFFFQKKKIYKTVFYFIAEVTGNVIIQEEEIQASLWLPLQDAVSHITFKEGKNLCLKVKELLDKAI